MVRFMVWRRHARLAWVPTIQGNTVDDYVWHDRYLQSLILNLPYGDWHVFRLGLRHPDFRVGIGSLCTRDDPLEVVRIVEAVTDVLGRFHLRFHLWGIKLLSLPALARSGLLPYVASFDTAAHNGGR